MYRYITSFTVLFILLSAVPAQSQKYYTALEIGLGAGASQYFGDLNQHYGFKTPHVGGGFYGRYRLNSYIAAKASVNYTRVGYDDKLESDPYQKLRNLNFKSDIFEFAVQAEFNFFAFITGDPYHRFTPYLTGGAGVFYYDPYTTLNGTRYYLRQMGTEGQYAGYATRKYSTTAICFPIGAGVKMWITKGVNLSVELADRLTTTDYLDDVSSTYVGADKFKKNTVAAALQDRSGEVNAVKLGREGKQRGNTSSKDQYFMALISVSFNFTSYKCTGPLMSRDDEMRVR
jgi:Domain of unknown function (DUF6089)